MSSRTVERTPTGIEGLDPIIDGGFPRGSLILLAGNPGTGKTLFAVRFIAQGATAYGENGVYVSFAEGKDQLVRFTCHQLNIPLEECPLNMEEKVKILDLTTMKEEGISDVLNAILDEVKKIGAKRLVIDSFSAMAQAFREKIDVRIILHTILGKIVRQVGCTTLLVCEVPAGGERIGLSIEEFVADGIIMLRQEHPKGRLLRKIDILKMRGSEVKNICLPFTLKDGFHVFQPQPEVPDDKITFPTITVREGRLPTGFEAVDALLGGGALPGSCILLNADADVGIPIMTMATSAVYQAVKRGHGVVIIPARGVSAPMIRSRLAGLTGKAFDRYVRVIDYGKEKIEASYWLQLKGRNIDEDFSKMWRVMDGFKKKTGKLVLSIVGWDMLEYMYGPEATVRILGRDLAQIRNKGHIRINITRPSVTVTPQLSEVSDHHYIFTNENCINLFYCAKHSMPFYGIEFEAYNDKLRMNLTPVV